MKIISIFRLLSPLLAIVYAIPAAQAQSPSGRIVLLPIDDRPAVGQFAQLIGAVADQNVILPPREMLGRFTTPGDADGLHRWLRSLDYSTIDALIVSVDMLAYGGLVASRVHNVAYDDAAKRLEFFRWFRSNHPRTPVYAFNVIMRVAPTATAATRGVHDKLARWAELKDRAAERDLTTELNRLTEELDPKTIEAYMAARKRDLRINLAMLELAKDGVVDQLILLQDDARPYGLHRQDQAVLRAGLKEMNLETRVPIYNGADEGSLSLVSRAVLDRHRRKLRVSVVYSSEKSKGVIAPFEDHPLHFTVESQLKAAGAIPARENEKFDYRLFVNAPGTTDAEFEEFLQRLLRELKGDGKVALADLLFPNPHFSGADERIIAALKRENLFDRFAGYAAWNTAGNTLGTAIPHANMRVLAGTIAERDADRLARAEAAHLDFLLNRFAGDYLYHDIVRLGVNRRLRREAKDGTATYELSPQKYEEVNREVESELRRRIETFFADHFNNRTYRLSNNRSIKITGLESLKIYLPWSRTFEAAIENRMRYRLR